MAGFREFVTGEVLTAANVDDFLAKQAVMKFADAAARDSALGTAVAGGNALREGMVAYLDDTNDVLKYDGSSWLSVGPGKVLQVVVGTDSTDRTTTSTVFVDANISVSITPINASSTLYAFWSVNVESGNSDSSSASASRTHLQITDASDTALEGAEFVNVMGRQQGTIPTAVEGVPFILGRVAASDTTARTYKGRFKYEGNATGAVCALRNTESTGMIVVLEVGP